MCCAVLSRFSHVQLCNPMDCSLPGSSIHGILQVRTLEWVAMPSSRGFSQPRDWTCVSYVYCIDWQAGSLPLAPPGKPFHSIRKAKNELGFPVGSVVKNHLPMQEMQVRSSGREDSPGGGHGNPIQYSCLGNPRSLAGCGPWGHKQLDMT